MTKGTRICVACGTVFSFSPSDKNVTCSRECSRLHRVAISKGRKHTLATRKALSQKAKERGYTAQLQLGTDAAQKSPKAGRFETNASAKSWVIVSPEGEVFEFVNLRHWCRNNYMLFGFEADMPASVQINRIASGFRVIKKNVKSGRGTTTYRGWGLLAFGDKKNCEKQEEKLEKE